MQRREVVQDVAELGLDDVDHRAVAEAGVGPDHQAQVGEARHGGAPQRPHVAAPGLRQGDAIGPGDAPGDGHVHRAEPGGQNDHVHIVGGAVPGDHGVAVHPGEAGADHLHVRPRQRRIEVAGQQDPLAAHHVARRQPAAQDGVGHGPCQVARCDTLAGLQYPRPRDEGGERGLPGQIVPQAGQPLGRWKVAVDPLFRPGDDPVTARQHPGRGALEQHQAGRRGLDLGHDLDRGCPGADHRDPLAAEMGAMVPAC